jgi:hypothetical protein
MSQFNSFAFNDSPPPDLETAHRLFLEAGTLGLLKGQFLLGPRLFVIPKGDSNATGDWIFRSAASTSEGVGAVGYLEILDPLPSPTDWGIRQAANHASFVPYSMLPPMIQEEIMRRVARHMNQFLEATGRSLPESDS